MDKDKKDSEECCSSGGCGSGCGGCGAKMVMAIVLLLVGGIIGYLMGVHCGMHRMGMGCPMPSAMMQSVK
jgi:hypothetical protein